MPTTARIRKIIWLFFVLACSVVPLTNTDGVVPLTVELVKSNTTTSSRENVSYLLAVVIVVTVVVKESVMLSTADKFGDTAADVDVDVSMVDDASMMLMSDEID